MGQSGNLTERATDQASVHILLARAIAALARSSESPQLDAQLLLAHLLHRPRSYLAAHPEHAVDSTANAQFQALLARRGRGEPLAYLLGEREFWSLALSVTPAVLIPRPETELAVERCLALHPGTQARIADLGTGSGAIALALAIERPNWHISATDLSAAALDVARANAERLGAGNIEFLEGDWLAPLAGRRFDLIVSNPPYIGAADSALRALQYEPAAALTPGPTGIEALQRIIKNASRHLQHGGWLVLEHGAEQAHDVALMLVAAGYARVGCYCDLAGRERVSQALWP